MLCLKHFIHIFIRSDYPSDPLRKPERRVAVNIFKKYSKNRFHPLPFQRFQVLYSLFKVLLIFPSQYLFAIGFTSIFSFRRSLSPILGCIPKQPDSLKTSLHIHSLKYGALTLFGLHFQVRYKEFQFR